MTTTDMRPDPPSHLSAKATTLWRSIIERYELEDEELATPTLALEAWDIAQTARRTIGREGQRVEDRFGQAKPVLGRGSPPGGSFTTPESADRDGHNHSKEGNGDGQDRVLVGAVGVGIRGLSEIVCFPR